MSALPIGQPAYGGGSSPTPALSSLPKRGMGGASAMGLQQSSSRLMAHGTPPPPVRFGFDGLGLDDLADDVLWEATDSLLSSDDEDDGRSSPRKRGPSESKDSPMNRLAQGMITAYQFVTRKVPGVSHVWQFLVRCAYTHDPKHQGEYQSCSEYGMSCFKELPFHRAVIQTAKRLLTCSPLYFLKETPGFRWAQGWVDDVKTIDATKQNLGLNQVA